MRCLDGSVIKSVDVTLSKLQERVKDLDMLLSMPSRPGDPQVMMLTVLVKLTAPLSRCSLGPGAGTRHPL